MNVIKDIYVCCLSLLGLHYLYSFVFLYTFLKSIGVSDLSVISIEDITFAFANSSYLIIGISLMGLLLICIWSLLINNEDEVINQFQKGINLIYSSTQKKLPKFMLIIFTRKRVKFLLVYIIVALAMSQLFFNKEPGLLIFWFLLAFGFPLFYVYWKKKRKLLLIVYICSSILFGVVFINYSIASASKLPSHFHNISFKYNGEEISNTNQKNCCLVYSGYKYIILYDTVAHKSYLYSTNNISKISY